MTRRTAAFAFVVLLALAARAAATATEASELSCEPANVVPGQNMTCTVRGRDATQETTRAAPSDFITRVYGSGTVNVSPIMRSEDETLVFFTVNADHGTRLSVEVVARNGIPIRGSGFQGLVYASPPTSLAELTCDKDALTLRQSMTCTVPAVGDGDVPAAVSARDVFYSEDHGDGTFDFLRGDGAFVFTFTAPVSPSAQYDAFTIRVALTGSLAAPRNISIPVRYPIEAPTTRSTLVCTDSDYSHCTVNAASSEGLVKFSSDDFVVSFEEEGVAASGGWRASTAMVADWREALPSQMPSFGNLRVDQRVRTRVMRVRTHVRLAATGEEIGGSPHVFLSGIAPTASDVTMRRCSQSYMVAGRTTTCYLSVANGASAATRFITATLDEGEGEISELYVTHGSSTGIESLAELPLVIAFNYTADSDVEERMDAVLAVSVQGEPAVRSPVHLVVFPSTAIEGESVSNERPPVIAMGLCFFGSGYLLGFIAFVRRNARIRRVKAARRQRELDAAHEAVEQDEQRRRDARRNTAPFNSEGAAAAATEMNVHVRRLDDSERAEERAE